MFQKTSKAISEHIRNNKYTYISLFIFYLAGILAGAYAVNELDYNQKSEMTNFFNGFLKLLDGSGINAISLFKISLLDNIKIILLFWVLGFIVIGFPVFYIVIGMRGFSTGFSSGVIMSVLGSKGILISVLCFLPKEIIIIPCLIAIAVNAIKLTKDILKNCFKRPVKSEYRIKQRILPYSFVTIFYSTFIFLAIILEAFISPAIFKIISII